MTYFDVDGRVGQGPTLSGLAAFHDWAVPYPATKQFLDHGETIDMAAVAAEMNAATVLDPDLNEIRVALADAAENAVDILILSDE